MTELIRFEAGKARSAEILEAIEQDGAVILIGAFSGAQIEGTLAELAPFIAGTRPIEDDFVGRQTTRTGGLVARSKTAREAILHPVVLDAVGALLGRFAENYQLNLTQIMRLLPGQPAQKLHRDRYLWSRHLPPAIEPMCNAMWALTEFTAENGATRVIPGSQRWDWDRPASPADAIPAAMPAGSVLLYTGSVLHGGGENRASAPRIGMNITYVLGWLRQEENQYLSCPPEIARTLDPALQALIGYTVGNGGLGYFSPPTTPSPDCPDTLPPEAALGRSATYAEQESF